MSNKYQVGDIVLTHWESDPKRRYKIIEVLNKAISGLLYKTLLLDGSYTRKDNWNAMFEAYTDFCPEYTLSKNFKKDLEVLLNE